MKKIMVYTHGDLDGLGCYQLVRWTFPNSNIEVMPATPKTFKPLFTQWLTTHTIESYDKVFIMDLDVSDAAEFIDHKKVFIIDHHISHEKVADHIYKKASTIIMDYTSAVKLAYKAFKKLYNIKLTLEQKRFIALVDDYDSYKLSVPESKQLNIVFWKTNNRFVEFSKSFILGFTEFNFKQQNLIKLHETEINNIRNTMSVYHGVVKIQNKDRKVYSTFASELINDVADILLHEYHADVAIVVNNETNHISFRKSTSEYNKDLDLTKLANTIADGAGHEYASGGNVTEKFIEFSKLLKPIVDK